MKIIASFDDGVKEDLMLSEMMKDHGIETIFYFPAKPQEVNEPFGRVSLTPKERQQIGKDHEIGSHTVKHPLLTRIPLEKAYSEVLISRKFLQREFAQKINAFCYPRGYANADLQKLVQDVGYTHARGVTVGFIDTPENPYYEETTVHVGCNRKEYGGLSWYEYALKMLELAIDQKDSIYHFWGHGWEIAKDVHNFDLLNDLCDRLITANKGDT